MRRICTAISQLLCLSFAFELITLTLARMHSLEALAGKGSSNAFVLPSSTKSAEVSTSYLGAERRLADTSKQTMDDILSAFDLYHKHISSSDQRASVLEIIASALHYPSGHSRRLDYIPLKQHKIYAVRGTTRTGSIENAGIGESSFPKKHVELFRSFPQGFFTSKRILHNRRSQYQQKHSSESSARRRHRHLVKRQSSLITEYCGHLGRERCLSLRIGHCVQMCVNGRRHRTVCRLRHQHRDAFCIVRNSAHSSPTS